MERIELTRECEGVQVPAGNKIMLEKGLEAFITQSLGGTFTVQVPAYGGLYRIAGRDADALGKTPAEAGGAVSAGGDLEAMVWEQLKTCYDPEIPVNIVDLGLIYDSKLTPMGENNYQADVKMTLTAPGCGMGPTLAQDVQNKLLMIEEIEEANVELVWDPPWNQGMMTEAAKLQLGLM